MRLGVTFQALQIVLRGILEVYLCSTILVLDFARLRRFQFHVILTKQHAILVVLENVAAVALLKYLESAIFVNAIRWKRTIEMGQILLAQSFHRILVLVVSDIKKTVGWDVPLLAGAAFGKALRPVLPSARAIFGKTGPIYRLVQSIVNTLEGTLLVVHVVSIDCLIFHTILVITAKERL